MKALTGMVILMTLLVAPLMAQVSMGINFYAGGGFTSPTSDLNDITKNGFHYMAAAGYSPVPMFEVTGRYARHSMSLEAADEEDFTVAEYGADLRASLSLPGQKIKPYALIGGGAAKYDFPQTILDQVIDAADAALGGIRPKTKFYYSFGAGFKLNALPKLNFFLEGRYTRISVDQGTLSYLPITGGLNLSL